MKYMGWSYTQLLACPDAYVAVISKLARDEARAMREAKAQNRGARRRR